MVEVLNKKSMEKPLGWLRTTLLFLIAIFLFLLAIDLVGESVTMLGQDTVRSILLATSNPFIGLFIGLLATALVQSSSTVTAMTVAVVASGYLTLGNAIPVVMGANVGTTLTSTLVSLGFITNRNQFRKAISAGTIHDFFNIITVLIVFPLEYYYGTMSYFSQELTGLVNDSEVASNIMHNSYGIGIDKISTWLVSVLPQNFITVFLSLILLFVSIKFLSNIIYKRLIGSSKENLKKYIFANPFKSFGWGIVITGGVQSSSITTSLVVPLVASGKVMLHNVFPFIMGANIGTTITALLAAFNKSEAALSLAFVHLLFNLVGVLVFLPFPAIRRFPIFLAGKFGELTLDSRLVGFSYILFTFFLMPFALIYFNQGYVTERTYRYESYAGSEVSLSTIKVRREVSDHRLDYLLYEQPSPRENAPPDTMFMISDKQQSFAALERVYSYEDKGLSFEKKYQILSHNDTSTYKLDEVKLEHLNYIEVKMDESIAHFWFDADQKIIIRSEHYDGQGRLLKSSKLLSIQ